MHSHDSQIDGHESALISDAERLDRLRLIRSENVGPITFRQLLDRFGSATAALGALPELASRGGRRRPLKLCPSAVAERELDALREIGAELIHIGEADYPAVLAAAEGAPPVLAVLGHAHLLQRRAVAVVGARNA
ncbi:MAG: DNA-processing protein DprA, partial [Alphaproteobacteria bacterium]|nr:DNA-processing protein DprA [Alphaproteobacteria bacterium]